MSSSARAHLNLHLDGVGVKPSTRRDTHAAQLLPAASHGAAATDEPKDRWCAQPQPHIAGAGMHNNQRLTFRPVLSRISRCPLQIAKVDEAQGNWSVAQ
jgi:hypothetical protein